LQVVDALQGGEEFRNFGRNFLPSDFGDVLATLAITSRADKWMLQLDSAGLDSAGQKGPEIILE
jgi:hypothetical protein